MSCIKTGGVCYRLNACLSSALWIVSGSAPKSFTLWDSRNPSSASCIERVSPVCPPRVDKRLSGCSISIILVVETVEDAMGFAKIIGYPVIVRPAFTLGGTGGGIAYDEKELHEIATNGLRLSPITQILVEKCISGWKEIEFEVIRDGKGNVITVCSMENFDPVGVHTGDSIVIAPAVTLTDREYQMLRTAAINIIKELKVEGGCNCQFALHPESFEYAVIEVNPRVSRSSALASKASYQQISSCSSYQVQAQLNELPSS